MKLKFVIIFVFAVLTCCAEKDYNSKMSDSEILAVCGIVPGVDFKINSKDSSSAQISFSATNDMVLAWVYHWPVTSSNFEHMLKYEFISLYDDNLQRSGEILFTGQNVTLYSENKGRLYNARCRVVKLSQSTSKCIIDISYLSDM